ncbi:MAG: hypothetical protein R3321_04665 [Nitrososphaeraceae archaeon]|nr:hypothetical protein [Nitrososphaeraceae archaeon]
MSNALDFINLSPTQLNLRGVLLQRERIGNIGVSYSGKINKTNILVFATYNSFDVTYENESKLILKNLRGETFLEFLTFINTINPERVL